MRNKVRSVMVFAQIMILAACGVCTAAPQLPVLQWQPRSDWVNVKVDFGAVGDGVADDTAAIQRALDAISTPNRPRPVFFPAGKYKLTETLHLKENLGGMLIGTGATTRLEWAGATDGVMFWSDGCTRFRYIGLVWDGKGVAGVGVDHSSNGLYETRIRHQNEQFTDFRIAGIRGGNNFKTPSAEIYFDNCLFYRCTRGFSTNMARNYYNNLFVGCEFQDNEYGIYTLNAYVRNCHFERSSKADMFFEPHSYSVRQTTSEGSFRFIQIPGSGSQATIMLNDCRVDGWKATDGAVISGSRGPVIIADTAFTNPPNANPPIRLTNASNFTQPVVLSNLLYPGASSAIDPGDNGTVSEISGTIPPAETITAATSFFRQTAFVPGQVLDVKQDFGAKADGRTDDTDAIRKAIGQAKSIGGNALVYLPQGDYVISDTLDLSGGADFALGGSGYRTVLKYTGTEPCILLNDPKNLRVENMVIRADPSIVNVRQTSTPGTSSFVVYDGLYCQRGPEKRAYDTPSHGLEIFDLPSQGRVFIDHLDGHLWLRSCSAGYVLANLLIDGVLRVSNEKNAPTTGFFGVNTRICALNDFDNVIYDNESVIIGDYYSENTNHSLRVEDSTRAGTGRITIRYAKMGTLTNKVFSVGNYGGRLGIFGAMFYPQRPTELEYSGTKKLDIVVCGNSFFAPPSFPNFPANVRFVLTKNVLNDDTKGVVEGQSHPDEAVLMTKALQDFQELGRMNLLFNSGLS